MWGSSFSRMRRWTLRGFAVFLVPWLMTGGYGVTLAQTEGTPLRFLKEQELKNRDLKGSGYLGKVMTLVYPAYGVEPEERYHSLLLELTDVLKTPLRDNYRLVLRGYSDGSGSPETNRNLSKVRAETLKKVLIRKYYMPASRITGEGFGSADPVASNETPDGRGLNRRVEVHVYGDVSEAIRFVDKEEDKR